jgi:hypothetical protein
VRDIVDPQGQFQPPAAHKLSESAERLHLWTRFWTGRV